jgi:hypothetical protein
MNDRKLETEGTHGMGICQFGFKFALGVDTVPTEDIAHTRDEDDDTTRRGREEFAEWVQEPGFEDRRR